MAFNIYKTFKSDHIKGGAVRMECWGEYYKNGTLKVWVGKEFFDEENYDWANEFVQTGFPWVVTREVAKAKFKAVGFKTFRDAIEYIILYQEDMGKDPTFLPRGIDVEF